MTDSSELLRQCDSGCKMAVSSIKDVLGSVKSEKLLKLLTDSISLHEEIGNDISKKLNEIGLDSKEPNAMAKTASWLKINVELLKDKSDETVASLISDGCSMGIKELTGYLNKYESADPETKKVAEKLIAEEEGLLNDLKEFL